ncbi:MAG: hypothetical protein E6Q50_05360 [Lysobacter sp.]|nr:MAG: hypothetical protein E6Q50_05360 [Lysobacter sp.]
MAESSSAAAPQRVALLARPGKAADNLVEALRQSGAELVLVADPNALDEATLLAAHAQAVLVALEPGIESAVDRLDSVLSLPSLTVIFDEADLAAHRAGWDAARWVRHLSAKLNHHQRVLPPGGEAETEEWYPSPGHLPAPSSAFAEADIDAFAQEAAARAVSVPADGMSAEAAAAALSIDPSLFASSQTVPSGSGGGGDPWGDDAGLDAAAIPTAFPAPSASPSASDTVAAASVDDATALDLDAIDFDALTLDAIEVETIERDAVRGDAARTDAGDAFEPEALEAESFEADVIDLEAIGFDTAKLDTLDTLRIEGFDAEAPKIAAPAPAAEASGVQPLQFDDDAFFLESLSADTTRPVAFDDAPLASFEPEFALDTSFDAPVMPPPLPDASPTRAPAVDDVVPDALAANELAAGESLGFALDTFDAGAPQTNDAAAPVADSRSTARNVDLTSLEARISSLSLVDIDRPAEPAPKDMPAYVDFTDADAGSIDSAPASSAQTVAVPEPQPEMPPTLPPPVWDAPSPSAAAAQAPTRFSPPSDIGRGLVVIEAGLGGPDPVRQVLAGLPASFPMPVLVRLHLQGGRYDRLVAQMERAASLPVMLAEVGDFVRTGCIYFLPEGVGLNALRDGFEFIAHPSPALTIFAALPAQDSAVLFLSGSDAGLIEDAMQAVDDGALVVAQSPEDCYDGAACAYLRSRGAASGLPPELAARLVARWPS